MRTVRDAKLMARTLEAALRGRSIPITCGESLDLVARQFGLRDWNVLSARLKRLEVDESRLIAAPRVWAFLAEHPSEFEHGVMRDGRDGTRLALIRHVVQDGRRSRYHEPGTIFRCYAQTVPALPFRGRRVAVSARLCTESVSHGATIWTRVGGYPHERILAFDNLKDSAAGWLFGDHDWTRRDIVIDVAAEAETFSFGFFLKGTGVLRVRDVSVAEVDPTVSPTAPLRPWAPVQAACGGPENLDFAQVVGAPEGR